MRSLSREVRTPSGTHRRRHWRGQRARSAGEPTTINRRHHSPRRPRPSTNPQEDTNHPTGHGGTIRQSHPQPSNTQEANNNQPHRRQRLQPPKADRTASPPGKTHALTTPPTSTPDRQETTNRTPGVAAGEDPSPASVRIDRLEHLLLQRPPPPVIGCSRRRALRSRAAKSCRSGPWVGWTLVCRY